jgi:hypothetical protein
LHNEETEECKGNKIMNHSNFYYRPISSPKTLLSSSVSSDHMNQQQSNSNIFELKGNDDAYITPNDQMIPTLYDNKQIHDHKRNDNSKHHGGMVPPPLRTRSQSEESGLISITYCDVS